MDTYDKKTSATVVVCVYTENRLPLIQMALDSIIAQTRPPEQVVVVVDHNPPLADTLMAKYPKFEIVANKFNRGLSGARNTGIEYAFGDVVVFIDDDAWADSRWLEQLLSSYDDSSVIGVGGLLLPVWGPSGQPEWLPDEFLWVLGCSYRGLPAAGADVRNPVGANMSFRRSAFERVGSFSYSVGRTAESSRPLGCEETEFSIRLRKSIPTSRITFDPRAVVHHHVDESRATWRYFARRCHAEGRSKAQVARLAGAAAALSSERSYVSRTILHAAHRELSGIFGHARKACAGRLMALSLGTSAAASGYIQEAVTIKLGRLGRRNRPA